MDSAQLLLQPSSSSSFVTDISSNVRQPIQQPFVIDLELVSSICDAIVEDLTTNRHESSGISVDINWNFVSEKCGVDVKVILIVHKIVPHDHPLIFKF